jgi:hypothetical protein
VSDETTSIEKNIVNEIDQKPLTLELNKLEQREELAVCYFMIQNQLSIDLPQLKLELFSFNQERVINGHFLADFGAIPANKKVVKLIPVREVNIKQISSILLNRVMDESDSDPCCSLEQVALYSRVKGVSMES